MAKNTPAPAATDEKPPLTDAKLKAILRNLLGRVAALEASAPGPLAGRVADLEDEVSSLTGRVGDLEDMEA